MDDAMPEAPAWRLLPRFLLRRAGFPFRLLERLSCEAAAAAADEWARRTGEAEELRAALLSSRFPAEVSRRAAAGDRPALRKLSTWRRKVGRRAALAAPEGSWPPPLLEAHAAWVAAARAGEEARRSFERAFAAELAALGQALHEAGARADVREAVFLLVPGVLEALERSPGELARAPLSSLGRRFHAFVQRLAAKNETTSFFGPLTHGHLDAGVSAPSFGPEEAERGVLERKGAASFWAVAALGDAIAADPAVRPHVPARRIPAAAVDGEGRAFGPNGQEVPLSPDARALFAAVNDARPLAELAAASGLPPDRAERALRELEKRGFARRDLEPLSTSVDPLADLRRRAAPLPSAGRWLEAIDQLQALVERFERSPLDGRRKALREAEALFEKATSRAPRRGAGQMYADRTVLSEDCAGDMVPARLPESLGLQLQRAVAPALQLGASYGAVRHRALRALAGNVLQALGGRARFLTFAAALDARIAEGALGALDAEARTFLEELARRVRARSDGRTARLDPRADLEGLASAEATPRFASPDVMLEELGDGSVRFVVGEVHPYVYAWGSQGQFAPDPAALREMFAADLRPWGGAERMAVVLRRRQHKGLLSDWFPGRFVEVVGRASDDPRRKVAVGDLRVEPGPDGPRLRGPEGELSLYVGEDDHPHLRVFAPPLVEMPRIRLGAHTPRVELGSALVLQRERWELEPAELADLRTPDPAELFRAVARARRVHGWPRFAFAASPREPKPLCIDLGSPFGQASLRRLLELGPVGLSEMLPGPGGLWLRRSSGAFTSELRLGMIRGPAMLSAR